MQIYTRFLPPTNSKGSRIKVWTEWDNGNLPTRKIVRTYASEYSHHEHQRVVAMYLKEWPEIARKSGIFHESIIDIVADKPCLTGYYQAEIPRGYIFTKTAAYIEWYQDDN